MARSFQDAIQWTFETFVYSTTREATGLQPRVAEHLLSTASLPLSEQKSAINTVTQHALKFLRIFDKLYALSTSEGLSN